MLSNLFDKNIVRVISYFLISPGSRYKRKDIKEKTKMNNIPLDETLCTLLSLKILTKENNLYTLNIKSEEGKEIIKYIKEEYNRFGLPHNIFNILIEVTEKLLKLKNIKEITLFGSYAKLIYTDKSDIDIAIIFQNSVKNKSSVEKKINKLILKTSNKNKKNIEAHFFLEKDLKHKDLLIKDIIRNGKKLI